MKKLLMAVLVTAGAWGGFAEMSLADARGKIDAVIESVDAMKATMKELSAADQKSFLAEVNKAISQLPGSAAEKAKKYLAVNQAALVSAKKGNVATLLAEAIATVPLSVLPAFTEQVAGSLLDRSGNPERTYTDAQFEAIALEVMSKVNARAAEVDKGDIRSVFAVIMMVRASNGTPKDLTDKLVATIANEETREMAKKEWIPAALASDKSASESLEGYEAILATADVETTPDQVLKIFVIQGPQFAESILNDLQESCIGISSTAMYPSMLDAVNTTLSQQVPILGGNVPGAAGQAGGATGANNPDAEIKPNPNVEPVPVPEPEPEPKPYNGQTF